MYNDPEIKKRAPRKRQRKEMEKKTVEELEAT